MGCNCNKSKVTTVTRPNSNVQTVQVRQNAPVPKTNSAKRVITRNPNHNGNLFWVSEWAAVVVSLNGKLLDPSEFIYANEGGWVDKIVQPLKLNYNDQGIVTTPDTERVKGEVVCKFFTPNHCQDCRRAMKAVQWWEIEHYTNNINGTIKALKYTESQLNEFKDFRQQVWQTIKA
jgi:hypothetical protein